MPAAPITTVLVLVALSATALAAPVPSKTGPDAAPFLVFGGIEHLANDPAADPDAAATVWITEKTSGDRRVLWHGKGNIDTVTASPTYDLIAFRERVQTGDTGTWQLRLVDTTGKEKKTLPNVYRYAWSPDGAAIAYVIGFDREGGIGFRTQSCGIYSVQDERKEALAVDNVVDLNWAAFDGKLYLLTTSDDGEVVWSYDPKDGKAQETKRKGIYFSPEGTYYYRPGDDATQFGVYESKTDRSVDQATGTRGLDPAAEFAQPRGWLDEEQLVLPSAGGERGLGDTVLNVRTGKVSESMDRVISLGGGASRGLVVMRDGKVEQTDSRSLELAPTAGTKQRAK